jgi:5-methylcytosine-specific restriction endonuclease McrA
MPRDKYGMPTTRSDQDRKKPWKQDYGDDWEYWRERTLRRDNYCCRRCGTSVRGTYKRAVHHIISLSRGGKTVLSNLITECSKCHDKEHPHLARLHQRPRTGPATQRPLKKVWSYE